MEEALDTVVQSRTPTTSNTAISKVPTVELGANQQQLHVETIDKPSSVPVRAVLIIPVPPPEIYEVTKDELETMTSGSETGLDFNVALTAISIAVSSAATLVTSQLSPTMQTVWSSVLAGSSFMGLYSIVRWWKSRNAVTQTIDKIKRRSAQWRGEK